MSVAVDDERLTDTFAALANTTRRAILAHLAEGAATVNELAAPFDMTLPAISKHLKVLERGRSRDPRAPGAVPTVRTGRGAAARGLHLGRAVPPRLGITVRPHGRVPPGNPIPRDKERP